MCRVRNKRKNLLYSTDDLDFKKYEINNLRTLNIQNKQ